MQEDVNMVKKEIDTTCSAIADEHVLRYAEKLLEPMVISQLDKNNNTLHVQCRYTWYQNLQEVVVDDPHYSTSNETNE
jgi:hypothetical protein